MKKIILVFSLLLFVFCTKKENQKTSSKISKEEPKFENTFKNHLYVVAPHLDDFGNLELGCDCCLSEVYFVDSERFIYVYYCLDGDDFLIGDYSVNKDGLVLTFKGERLSLEYNTYEVIEDTTNTIENTIKYKLDKIEDGKTIWTSFKRSKLYKTSDKEFTEESDSLKSRFFEKVNNDKEILKFLRKNNIKI